MGAMRPEASVRTPQAGYIHTPASSVARPKDTSLRAHTTYVIRSLDGSKPVGTLTPQALQTTSSISPDTVEYSETPASMGCLYVSSPSKRTTGCIPNPVAGTKGPSPAGWGAIALVDAYDNPDAASDLKAFDNFWKLPAAKFIKIYANGNGSCTTPPANADWSVEESLDIEWAHVFASKAVIILVEACSNSFADLSYADNVAINYIQKNYGGGQVSNSWSTGEFSSETSYDPVFAGWNYNYQVPVVTFASADDSGCGGVYPSSNPWLISAGGTSVLRNSDGTFNSESCWGGSGGGFSDYETYITGFTGSNMGPWADYQYPIFGKASRQTPDISFNADPASGVYVYNQYAYGGWITVGGTSVSSPSLASIVNRANNRLSTWYGYSIGDNGFFTNEEATLLYSQLPAATAYYANFYDITTGSNGCTVTYSWDYCTGVGSPRDLLGK
jgi:subtilase family serine protease